MKKICFITTSRADFGTLNELIKEIVMKNSFSTQLIISGNHFSNIFGNSHYYCKLQYYVQVDMIKNKNLIRLFIWIYSSFYCPRKRATW